MNTVPIKVLDHGFVRLVDTMGGDAAIVQAARVSYGAGTKTVSDDRALIRFMMSHGHTSPFEMAEAKFHVRVPMDCWRQWIRHRTANVNEYSTRYSEAIDERQQTRPDAWRGQSKTNKQGSAEFLPIEVGSKLTASEAFVHTVCDSAYQDRLAAGVAREQARKDLPLSTYTEAYWKIDLHNLLHFLEKRLAPDAQFEIRQYANAIADIVAQWVPLTWEAFENYRLHSVTLSREEVVAVRAIVREGVDTIRLGGSKREAGRIQDNLRVLGFDVNVVPQHGQ